MLRQPRLDAPGALHHVMGRGIDGTKVFRSDEDRTDFVNRLAQLAQDGSLAVYAWALMPNHFHLLVRTGRRPLFRSLKRLLTGYVVNFNRRHKRHGRLFQNRYKSIICEEDPYLLELTRYIHLNPVRGGLVHQLSELRRYPWTGHSAITGWWNGGGRTPPRCWRTSGSARNGPFRAMKSSYGTGSRKGAGPTWWAAASFGARGAGRRSYR